MTDASRGEPKMTTAGIDLGDSYSYFLCSLDTRRGEVIEEGRLRTTLQTFERRFGSEPPMRIAIEAGTHSPWTSRLLEECGHKVLVANARKIRLIFYAEGRMTDRVDAEKKLARLARLDPKLLAPIEHRGEHSQAPNAPGASDSLPRSREALVRTRARLTNHVRFTLKPFGHRLSKCSAQAFHKRRSPRGCLSP